MSQTFLTVAEARGGKLRQVAFETIAAASLSAAPGDTITAVLLGSGISELAFDLNAAGATKVYVVDHQALDVYNPEAYMIALSQVLEEVKPNVVYFGHTAIGRDLAPQTAVLLNAGLLSDVTHIERNGEEIVYTRPLYAGKAFEKKTFNSGIKIVTVRPNNIKTAEPNGTMGEIIPLTYPTPSLRTVVKEVVKKMSGKIDLTEAKIIVSGGRGVKSESGFKPLEDLANLLGGAVGASRGACDSGYCDYSLQIGQTGKVVTPEIYIACGISGAIQHLAGMSQSRVIVAINKDPEAPIFKVADYGIVGDLFEVVPMLTEEFRKIVV
ncbi:electron transfer flavoprotein alpha subunit apoprotein [Paenibacillus sp. yr247]|uniref:electron transfer flavoprotein subunit alpha/FixB family protein n=1 Tax=Paenibacillus sp. yr247 TaxID=1761880 RepID=UPI00088AA138|nr:electron transfer flavoprotein subunit alpha/FixB family protein [Paenibacillus sp. yr247]SDN70402.1 electron transfer flavoprotein alpha subunit apoprotein [Paenibacillus sp. yr247]